MIERKQHRRNVNYNPVEASYFSQSIPAPFSSQRLEQTRCAKSVRRPSNERAIISAEHGNNVVFLSQTTRSLNDGNGNS